MRNTPAAKGRKTGGDDHHLFGLGVENTDGEGVVAGHGEIGHPVIHGPVLALGIFAVAQDEPAGRAVFHSKPQFPNQPLGPVVVGEPDQHRRAIVVPLGQPCTQGWEKRSGMTPGTYQWRVFPLQIDGLRGPGYQQWNASVNRDIRFKERFRLSLRLDALNVLNHSFPAGPQQAPTNSQFGQINAAAANLNRFIQIQGHIRW